ncbi:MAG TPA: L,D-transpeptidase [Thermoanaerobaculia bacterium]|nr:L,D-transpeptidase [Thermoanaerobaculia bacterium]
MRATIFLLLVLLAIDATAALPVTLYVSLGEKIMEAHQGEAVVGTYVISPGLPKHPTPKGDFLIRRLVWNPRWVPPDETWAKGKSAREPGDPKNPMKVVKIFFQEPDYYIHGTADEHLLGDPASHGCIRVSANDAYMLARMIMTSGGVQKSESWYQSVINGRRSTTVRLLRPVRIKIGG